MPAGRQARVGDEDIDVRVVARQALDRGQVGEIDRHGRRAGLGRERLEHLGTAAGEHQPRALGVQAARDRVAEPARRAGEQDGPPGEVHAGNTATVALKPCRKGSPPTGPISPAAKKPAAGAPASSSSSATAS